MFCAEDGGCLSDEPDGLKTAIEDLRKIQAFVSDADYLKQLIWIAQTYLRELLLPLGAFDLAFVGTFGSGKSYCTYYTTFLAHDGIVVVDFSEASLSAMLDAGKDLGFEEADELLKAHKNDLVEAILRSGQTPWAQRIIMQARKGKDGERWKVRVQNLAGPKVYNYAGSIKSATASRALNINLDPTKDAWVVARSFVPDIYLRPVRIWLETQCKEAAKKWKSEDLEDYVLSEGFVKELEGLPTEFPRGRRIGGLMLIIIKILEWDIGDIVKASVKDQELWQDDEEVLEVAEYIAQRFSSSGEPPLYGMLTEEEEPAAYLPVTKLRKDFNTANRKGVYGMGKMIWSRIIRQIGFKEGAGKVKDVRGKLGPRGRWYLRLDAENSARLNYLVPSFSIVGSIGTVGAQNRIYEPTVPTVPTSERVLAKVLKRNVGGPCDLCKSDGENVSIIAPRGSHDMVKVCPPCAEVRFDFGSPPGGE